ncbi:MAG: hypothetical protein LAT82_05245 [Nanoarchaeota archaeon]|nr:hypothetical protein [Nanoarchaeota archaeon]
MTLAEIIEIGVKPQIKRTEDASLRDALVYLIGKVEQNSPVNSWDKPKRIGNIPSSIEYFSPNSEYTIGMRRGYETRRLELPLEVVYN